MAKKTPEETIPDISSLDLRKSGDIDRLTRDVIEKAYISAMSGSQDGMRTTQGLRNLIDILREARRTVAEDWETEVRSLSKRVLGLNRLAEELAAENRDLKLRLNQAVERMKITDYAPKELPKEASTPEGSNLHPLSAEEKRAKAQVARELTQRKKGARIRV